MGKDVIERRSRVGQEMLQVLENIEIAHRIFKMTLQGQLVSKMTEPGQFIHIKCGADIHPILRRPISICDVDLDKKQLIIIYRVEGEGTKLLAERVPGTTVDTLGPMGRGFPIEQRQKGDKVVLVGGGVGVPPLYYLSQHLLHKGLQVTHVLGFQSEKDIFLEKEFSELGPTFISTVDGSAGKQGFVTDVLDQWQDERWDALYTCGPTPMLKALGVRFEKYALLADNQSKLMDVYLSLEERMGCGIGACFACVYHIEGSETGYKKSCSDGPVFKLGEVLL